MHSNQFVCLILKSYFILYELLEIVHYHTQIKLKFSHRKSLLRSVFGTYNVTVQFLPCMKSSVRFELYFNPMQLLLHSYNLYTS